MINAAAIATRSARPETFNPDLLNLGIERFRNDQTPIIDVSPVGHQFDVAARFMRVFPVGG
jgi:hypothetical protein